MGTTGKATVEKDRQLQIVKALVANDKILLEYSIGTCVQINLLQILFMVFYLFTKYLPRQDRQLGDDRMNSYNMMSSNMD